MILIISQISISRFLIRVLLPFCLSASTIHIVTQIKLRCSLFGPTETKDKENEKNSAQVKRKRNRERRARENHSRISRDEREHKSKRTMMQTMRGKKVDQEVLYSSIDNAKGMRACASTQQNQQIKLET
jgi:hypothetical protein